MKRVLLLVIFFILLSATVLAVYKPYNATYGKVDNLEIGFDLFWGGLIGIVPYVFYVLAGLAVLWVMYKTHLFD